MATKPTSTTAPDGTIEEVDGRYVLRFERRFAHPVERVWEALTTPERMNEWLGEGRFEIELREGGRMESTPTGPPELIEAMVSEGGADPDNLTTRDTVLRVEPPLLLEHTFGGDADSVARWELQRDGDGCRLTLTHTEPPAFDDADAPRDLAGWHALLEQLEQALDGKAFTRSLERWQGHRDRYAAKLG
jgi:uncharacterized protein YndB with AHSA1/START domain